jgi:hypothetical protein
MQLFFLNIINSSPRDSSKTSDIVNYIMFFHFRHNFIQVIASLNYHLFQLRRNIEAFSTLYIFFITHFHYCELINLILFNLKINNV